MSPNALILKMLHCLNYGNTKRNKSINDHCQLSPTFLPLLCSHLYMYRYICFQLFCILLLAPRRAFDLLSNLFRPVPRAMMIITPLTNLRVEATYRGKFGCRGVSQGQSVLVRPSPVSNLCSFTDKTIVILVHVASWSACDGRWQSCSKSVSFQSTQLSTRCASSAPSSSSPSLALVSYDYLCRAGEPSK